MFARIARKARWDPSTVRQLPGPDTARATQHESKPSWGLSRVGPFPRSDVSSRPAFLQVRFSSSPPFVTHAWSGFVCGADPFRASCSGQTHSGWARRVSTAGEHGMQAHLVDGQTYACGSCAAREPTRGVPAPRRSPAATLTAPCVRSSILAHRPPISDLTVHSCVVQRASCRERRGRKRRAFRDLDP